MSAFVKPPVVFLVILAVALLLAMACETEEYFEPFVPTVAPAPDVQEGAAPLRQDIIACAPIEGAPQDPCAPGPVPSESSGGPAGYPSVLDQTEPVSIREMLNGTISFVPHIVIRATYIPDTVRCTSGNRYQPPSYVEADLFRYSSTIQCYADVRVNEYIIGDGPQRLTVMIHVHHYWEGSFVPDPDNPNGMSEEVALGFYRDLLVHQYEGTAGAGPGVYGREEVLFLGPADNLAVEVWQLLESWDVQVPEDPEEEAAQHINVIHPDRDVWRRYRPDDYETYRNILEPRGQAFIASVKADHVARLAEYGGRIGPADMEGLVPGSTLPMLVSRVNGLEDFHRTSGAYSSEGLPAQPPPSCGSAAPDGAGNTTLRAECITLLEGKDALRGTAALNWAGGTAIASWDGITTGPWGADLFGYAYTRVTKIKLPNKSLNGTIPAGLDDMLALIELDLSGNQLTGQIPPELGNLEHLAVLRLSGNALTGCIPPELKDVATNDLSELNLPYCADSPSGLRETTSGETKVSVSWDAVPNAAKYRVESLSPPAPLR